MAARWRLLRVSPARHPPRRSRHPESARARLLQPCLHALLHLGEAVGEGDLGPPAEIGLDARDVRERLVGIATAPRLVALVGRDHAGQLLDRDVGAAPDIVDLAMPLALESHDVGPRHVADMDEVAPLLALAMD